MVLFGEADYMNLCKRFIAVSLILTILISTFVFSFVNVSADVIQTLYVKGSDVRVRTGPSLSAPIIEKIGNTYGTILDSTSAEGYTWYHISYENGTKTGYVAFDDEWAEIHTYNPDASFEEKLLGFPESYRNKLRLIHSEYPNWDFIPDPVSTSFYELVALESVNMNKQINYSAGHFSWQSMERGSYDWNISSFVVTNGGYTGASKELIAYYMDPRNFLNSTEVFMFLQQKGFDVNTQTISGVRSIVSGTFMDSSSSYYNPAHGIDYAEVIMEAARQSNVSPYILAAKLRQECGVRGDGGLISGSYPGYEGLYNYFNFKASGATKDLVIQNGLTFARNAGWNTRSASIIGGASKFASEYINDGQDTFFYMDFNVKNVGKLWHQYAQAVYDADSKGKGAASPYKENKSGYLTFKIPVYPDLPANECPKPLENGTLNNYYLGSMSAPGLTPSFDKYENNYALHVSGDSSISVTAIQDTARVSAPSSFDLYAGTNYITIPVVSQSGYTNNYYITVVADNACKLYVNGSNGVASVVRGDTNGDGQITLRDLANVRLHLLGLINLTGDNYTGADTNADGQLNLRDLANVRLHLLGLKSIS